MRKVIFMAVFLMGCLTLKPAHAQVGFHVNVNIGNQPSWGPVGYSHADYYYMPDVESYYDVSNHQYIYNENNVWVHRASLPARYGNYDVYHGYKVVVNRPNPWLKHSYYQHTYSNYRGRHDQPVIRDSRDDRYKGHWHGDEGRGNGHDGGHRDNGNHNGDGHPGNGNRDKGHGHDNG